MGRFEVPNPLDSNIPYRLGKIFLNITIEAVSGRVGKEGGSFIWKGDDKDSPADPEKESGLRGFLRKVEQIVPTHGNYAGPGYSCGTRKELTREAINSGQPATVTNPKSGKEREDYVDILAKEHDDAYSEANGKPDYWEKVTAADKKLVSGVEQLLYGTSPRYANGGALTKAERAYGQALIDGFKLKETWMNQPMAAFEKLGNLGLDNKEINNFFNAVTRGFQFYGPREFLRKLNLSESETQEIEQKYAAYCDENGLDGDAIMEAGISANQDGARTASRYPDEYEDEDQDYYYGPGMGMG